MVLGRGAILVASGIGIGVVIALAVSRLLESLVFGIAPTDGDASRRLASSDPKPGPGDTD